MQYFYEGYEITLRSDDRYVVRLAGQYVGDFPTLTAAAKWIDYQEATA